MVSRAALVGLDRLESLLAVVGMALKVQERLGQQSASDQPRNLLKGGTDALEIAVKPATHNISSEYSKDPVPLFSPACAW